MPSLVLEVDKVRTSNGTVVDFDQVQSNLDSAVSTLKGTVTSTYDTLGKLETAVTSNDSDITTLQTNVSTNSTDISTLQGTVSTNSTDIGNIQADYATQNYVTTEVNTLRSDILGGASTAYDTLQEIEAYLGNNDTDITNIVNTMATKAPLPASATTAGQVLTWTGTAFFNDSQPITDLNADIATNANDIATLQTNQSALTTTVNTNTANISTNTNDIATLQTDLATAQNDITTNATDIASNDTDIATLQTDVATNTTTIASHGTRLTTAESNISTLQTDVSTNTAGIAVNVSDISSLQSDLATANTTIAGIQSDVSDNTADISTLVSDVSTLQTSVNTNTTDITTLTGVVNNKAAKPPAQTTTGTYLYHDGTNWLYGTPAGGGGGGAVAAVSGYAVQFVQNAVTGGEAISASGYSSKGGHTITTQHANSKVYFQVNGEYTINGTFTVQVHWRYRDTSVAAWSAWADTGLYSRLLQNDSWGVLKAYKDGPVGIHSPNRPAGAEVEYRVYFDIESGTAYYLDTGGGSSTTNTILIEIAI